ncbi:hypothetical protein JCM19237_1198 [Photobacterium aphoticum]|uniref:Uncharacterized protein n=1 Tax=Photobacterium aphoticum TaxID=754436 RepID=A0A090QNQ7_9GAMM|nr:hypothetical protein JCM19237_1198 [Photobacterium aphoticum]
MSEATLVKPRPGVRGKGQDTKTSGAATGSADQTLVLTKVKPSGKQRRVQPLGQNPLVEEASILLSIIGQIRSTTRHSDVSFCSKAVSRRSVTMKCVYVRSQ